MIRCLIVDDELPAREELKYILSKSNRIEIIGEAKHGLEGLKLCRKLKPDLMILDIQMPEIDGIEVARRILDDSHIPMIIFITAYDKFAIKAFEVNAIDYLLKPVTEDRLLNRIEKIYDNRKQEQQLTFERVDKFIQEFKSNITSTRIAVYDKNKLIPIDTKDIIYITIEQKNTVIITTKGKYESNNSLNDLYNKLNSKEFIRSHKSYILNLNYIESIDPWFNSTFNVNLKLSKDVIPVSRNYAKHFKEIMNID